MSVTVAPLPRGMGRDTRARRAAREALAAVLWNADGTRRLPTERALVSAIEACDRRDLWWVCEASSAGPLYLLPTREWVRALARFVTRVKARTVLEVAAGDGFLSACLAHALPGVKVIATDDHSWRRPAARMNDSDRVEFAGVDFAGITAAPAVQRVAATRAVKTYAPDLTVIAWAPPGSLVRRVVRAEGASLVLDLGADGFTGDTSAWRYRKEFLDGPLVERALCRLDARPSEGRATNATLYYGRAHPDHGEE